MSDVIYPATQPAQHNQPKENNTAQTFFNALSDRGAFFLFGFLIAVFLEANLLPLPFILLFVFPVTNIPYQTYNPIIQRTNTME
mmetsp:Transcript_17543/g.37077  ORF Transcript_17543/g.37077 Transcript_17543/m.37077 type:complete len:84 (-) Transcript_17543:1155-1406(-)